MHKIIVYLLIVLNICIPFPTFALQKSSIDFSFNKTKLIDIINLVASKMKRNIILPQAQVETDILNKQVVTYKPEKSIQVSFNTAWQLLNEFLQLTGFSIYKKRGNLYAISKNSKNASESGITREPLPLYVQTPPDQLPVSVERIRYINYLKNIKVPLNAQETDNSLVKIFKDMLSPGAATVFDSTSNGFIIIDSADKIATITKIILELDNTGFKEVIEIIPLSYVPASQILTVLDKLKKSAGEDKTLPFIRTSTNPSISYFAQDTTIIAHEAKNILILMGRENTIEHLREFIQEHIDKPQSSGKSILHIYNLQYLEAKEFAPILQQVISNQISTQSQAQEESNFTLDGYRLFKGVIVTPDKDIEIKPQETQILTEEVKVEQIGNVEVKGIEGAIKTGGNRLLIAAWQEDWQIIKELIKKLDIPQPQVYFDVLIVDFTYDEHRKIAGTTRNKTDSALLSGKNIDFLASHITPVTTVLGTTPTSLAQDLLRVAGQPLTGINQAIEPGSLLISFNDPNTPGTFALLQVLNQVLKSKILSHPYIVALNNTKAIIESQEVRRAKGDLTWNSHGTISINIENITATITLELTPHLNALDRLRVDVSVKVIDFRGSSLTRITRGLSTTAQMGHGQILALGGLIREDELGVNTNTPLLAKIPIFGSFFQGNNQRALKTNIVIFISPIIIQPKTTVLMDRKTVEKITDLEHDMTTLQAITQKKDPVTRLFFNPKDPTQVLVNRYLRQSTNMTQLTYKPTKKVKNKTNRSAKTILAQPEINQLQTTKLKELLAYEENPLSKNISSVKK